MNGSHKAFDIFRGFSEKIMNTPAKAKRTKVNKEEILASIMNVMSGCIGMKNEERVTKYPIRQEIKTNGPAKVTSASNDFLFGVFSRLPYLRLTSIVPLNHLVLCLKKPETVDGYSCQDLTSEAYLIL